MLEFTRPSQNQLSNFSPFKCVTFLVSPTSCQRRSHTVTPVVLMCKIKFVKTYFFVSINSTECWWCLLCVILMLIIGWWQDKKISSVKHLSNYFSVFQTMPVVLTALRTLSLRWRMYFLSTDAACCINEKHIWSSWHFKMTPENSEKNGKSYCWRGFTYPREALLRLKVWFNILLWF